MRYRWTIWAAILACGCSEPAPPRDLPVRVAKDSPAPVAAKSAPTGPVQKSFPGVVLTIPEGWEERPRASDVLLAEYRLEGVAGPGRLTMSSTGGGLEANLARWRGQFTRAADDPEPKQTTIPVDGQEAAVIELFGTFRDGFSGAEEDNWAMLGAAIPTGPATFFIKLTGPRETIAARRGEFMDVVKNARLER